VSASVVATAPGAVAAARPAYRVTGLRVLRSEWSKFWDLRSTWITLGLSMLLLIGFGILMAVRYDPTATAPGHFAATPTDAVAIALGGQGFAQLAIGVLGVLVAAGEYSTGMIRSTLSAVPKRLPVLWSKAAMFACVVFVLATAAVLVAFLSGEGPLAGTKVALSLSDSGVPRSLLGAGAYFALVGVIGVALGALIRSVAGGIAALVAGLMLLPVLTAVLPSGLADDISPYLPGNAGAAIFALTHDSSTLRPAAGLAVFAGWALLALAGAAYRLVRTDA
jgi:hypothetical protein